MREQLGLKHWKRNLAIAGALIAGVVTWRRYVQEQQQQEQRQKQQRQAAAALLAERRRAEQRQKEEARTQLVQQERPGAAPGAGESAVERRRQRQQREARRSKERRARQRAREIELFKTKAPYLVTRVLQGFSDPRITSRHRGDNIARDFNPRALASVPIAFNAQYHREDETTSHGVGETSQRDNAFDTACQHTDLVVPDIPILRHALANDEVLQSVGAGTARSVEEWEAVLRRRPDEVARVVSALRTFRQVQRYSLIGPRVSFEPGERRFRLQKHEYDHTGRINRTYAPYRDSSRLSRSGISVEGIKKGQRDLQREMRRLTPEKREEQLPSRMQVHMAERAAEAGVPAPGLIINPHARETPSWSTGEPVRVTLRARAAAQAKLDDWKKSRGLD